jgi:hypothetical protein
VDDCDRSSQLMEGKTSWVAYAIVIPLHNLAAVLKFYSKYLAKLNSCFMI